MQSELRNIERNVGLDDLEQLSLLNSGQETPLLWEQELGRLLSSFMASPRGTWGVDSSDSDSPSLSPSSSNGRDLQVNVCCLCWYPLESFRHDCVHNISRLLSLHRDPQSRAHTFALVGDSRDGSKCDMVPKESIGVWWSI